MKRIWCFDQSLLKEGLDKNDDESLIAEMKENRNPKALKGRILKIDEDVIPKWGEMSIEQCVHHLCDTFELAFGVQTLDVPKSLMLQNPISRWLVIDSPFPWPKGLKTPEGFIPKDPSELEPSREKLLTLLGKSEDPDVNFQKSHPVMGILTRTEWQHFLWRHLDYHLDQFGL